MTLREKMGREATDAELTKAFKSPPSGVVEWPLFTGMTYLRYTHYMMIVRCRGAAGGDTPMTIEGGWVYDTMTQLELEWTEIVLLPMSVAFKRGKP